MTAKYNEVQGKPAKRQGRKAEGLRRMSRYDSLVADHCERLPFSRAGVRVDREKDAGGYEMVKKIKLKCPNCGRRIADYSGNSEALALLAETSEAKSDVVKVKCHLCKSQVSIMLDNSEVYMSKQISDSLI